MYRALNLILSLVFEILQIRVRLHISKILLYYLKHILRVKVAGEADGHIVWNVPFAVVVLYVGYGWVFEVLLCSKNCLQTIRVLFEELLRSALNHLSEVVCEGHILLLINGLKLCVETSYYVVFESVCLNLCPVLYLVGRDILHINCHIISGVGIGSLCSNSAHKFVVLVWNGIFGGLQRETVYYGIAGNALCGIGEFAVLFKFLLNLVQERFLLLVVHCSKLLCALEHKVLEIVGKTGGLGRVVLCSNPYCYVGLNSWSLLIYSHIDLKTILQGVNAGIERIIFSALVAGASVDCNSCCKED